MDFLNKAIFSSIDRGLLGLIVTSYEPDDVMSRAAVKLVTAEDLTTGTVKLHPRGFQLNDDGTLMSDTASRQVIVDSVFSYISAESLNFGPPCVDVTDVVLFGVQNNGYVLAEYEEAKTNGDITEGSTCPVPFSRFSVSNSSFNIYASYQQLDAGFRTCSLLRLEDGSAQDFYCALPLIQIPNELLKCLHLTDNIIVKGREMGVYKVSAGLEPFYTEVGEAFLNYLAYQVAFYNMGEDVLNAMKSTMPPAVAAPTVEEQKPRTPRRAEVNVSIEHCYKKTHLQGLFKLLGDPTSLTEFTKMYPEAVITYQWLVKIMTSPWVSNPQAGMSEDEAIYTACVNLLADCRKTRLKFALELLRHRYYIASMGVGNDSLGSVLKGGGVNGQSFKRASF